MRLVLLTITLMSQFVLASYNTEVNCKKKTCLILPVDTKKDIFAEAVQEVEPVSMLLKADLLPNDEELRLFDHSYTLQNDLDKITNLEQRFAIERLLNKSQEFYQQQLYFIPSERRVRVSSKGK